MPTTIHSTGTIVYTTTNRPAMAHRTVLRRDLTAAPLVPPHLGQVGLEPPQEHEGDQHDRQEEQHRQRRAQPESGATDSLPVREEPDALGLLGAPRHDEDRVEDAV